MRSLFRYLAVGLAIGLTVSLVFASWVFSAEFGRESSVRNATPQLLTQLLYLRAELKADLANAVSRYAEEPDETEQLGNRMSDLAIGLNSVIPTLPGASGDAMAAEAQYLQTLGAVLKEGPFEMPTNAVSSVVESARKASASLQTALVEEGVRVESGNPLTWDPTDELSALARTSQQIREAAVRARLYVQSRTENAITVALRVRDVADWSGMWITVDDDEPLFIDRLTYSIDGLDPLQTVSVKGAVSLGSGGEFRGSTTPILTAQSDHPPYSEAWLGERLFYGDFRVTRETYNGVFVGQTWNSISLFLTSTCNEGRCAADLDLSNYFIFDGYTSGRLRLDGDSYVLTTSGMDLGTLGYCSIVGTRTIRFQVTDAEMVGGVWSATELSGTVSHYSTSCPYVMYHDASFTAEIFRDL